jgi:hypothetical protein
VEAVHGHLPRGQGQEDAAGQAADRRARADVECTRAVDLGVVDRALVGLVIPDPDDQHAHADPDDKHADADPDDPHAHADPDADVLAGTDPAELPDADPDADALGTGRLVQLLDDRRRGRGCCESLTTPCPELSGRRVRMSA